MQSPIISSIAVAFMAMMIVILLFPSDENPTQKTMNYTVVVFGGIILLSTIYYFLPGIGGRHWFTGPARTVEDPNGSLQGSDDNSEKQSDRDTKSL